MEKKKFSIFILCDLLNDENGCEVSDENDFWNDEMMKMIYVICKMMKIVVKMVVR